MTILTGIKNAEYLVQYLGKKIAIRDEKNPKKYALYPRLFSIHDNQTIFVLDSSERLFRFPFDRAESPYIILEPDVEVEIR